MEGPTMFNSYMEVFAIRKKRLKQIIDEEFDGNQSAFSRHTGINTPQINRWLSESDNDKSRRNITEVSARDIERKCGKPFDWLDCDEDEMLQRGMLAVFRQLSNYGKEVAIAQAKAMLDREKLNEIQSMVEHKEIPQ